MNQAQVLKEMKELSKGEYHSVRHEINIPKEGTVRHTYDLYIHLHGYTTSNISWSDALKLMKGKL
jgi:hypothetical protein